MKNTLPGSTWLLAISLALFHGHPASAQMNMAGPSMGPPAMETRDEIPPDSLPAPLRMTGIGNSHIQITANSEAQIWFDQGLSLLQDFWDYESARAFEQGVRVDPDCAMCYWGLYKAESFYLSTAQGYALQSLSRAVALKNHVSERERLYIDASVAHEDAIRNAILGPVFTQELLLWRKLAKEYPEDTEARVFLAGRVGANEGLEIYRSILKEHPDDSAANHHYVHALEGGPHPEQALHSAEMLPRLAPASGHMVHMPGHIYFLLGDYARAEKAFDAAMQVDERYMREQHVSPDNDWNYVHNLMYAVANLMEEGKLNAAAGLSTKLKGARGELPSSLYINSSRDAIARLDARLPIALRIGDWEQVVGLLEARTQSGKQPNLDFLGRELSAFASGMQAIEARDIRKAKESSMQFEGEFRRMAAQPSAGNSIGGEKPKLQIMPDALLPPLLRSLSVMSLEMQASVLALQGQPAEAKAIFAKAAQAEKALGYHEPPADIRPAAETEAAVMMAIDDWADAKAAYETALLERPRSGFALYGIAICQEKAGETNAATKAYTDFLSAWKDADPALAQISHARTYLAAHDNH